MRESQGHPVDFTREIIPGLVQQSIGRGLDEPIRILDQPRVIDRQMVGNEIEDETDTKLLEPLSKYCELLTAAECGIHLVPMNRIG